MTNTHLRKAPMDQMDMIKIRSVISNIFSYKGVCSVCLKVKKTWLWDTVYNLRNGTNEREKSLKEIIGLTFGIKVTTLLPTNYFCDNCIDIILKAHQMVQEILNNHTMLQYYTKKLKDQVDCNIVKLTDDIQSVVFRLDYWESCKSLVKKDDTEVKPVIKKTNDHSDDDCDTSETFINESNQESHVNSKKSANNLENKLHNKKHLELRNSKSQKQLSNKANKVAQLQTKNATSGVSKISIKLSNIATKNNLVNRKSYNTKTTKQLKTKASITILNKNKEFKCYSCKKVFPNQHKLIEHSKDKCVETDIDSRTGKIKISMKVQDEDEMHSKKEVCELCGKMIASQNLTRHRKRHKKQKQCPTCMEFVNIGTYNKHLTMHEEPNKRLKSCPNCSYVTKYPVLLDGHINKAHLKVRPYKCNKCPKSFHSRLLCNEHLKIHERQKIHQCDICGDRFLYKKSLILHMRIHTGYKPYKCEMCEESFLSSSRRQTHTLAKHSEGPSFQCEVCLRKYYRRTTLKRHQRTHDCKQNSKIKRVL